MVTLLWILAGIAGLVLFLFLFGWVNAMRATYARNRQLDSLIQPALDVVAANDSAAAVRVAEFAANPAARNHLFARLAELGKADLFPSEYRTPEKAAESDLACWLMHRNELGEAPRNIELMQEIPIADAAKPGRMFLFRFRTDPAHWAANRGWMAGVAGPYWDGEAPPDFATATFSELTSFERMSPEGHLEFLRESLGRKGLVVRA